MKYRERTRTFDALKWMQSGDHSAVKKYPHRCIYGQEVCPICRNPVKEHGFIPNPSDAFDGPETGQTVCPGDFIVSGQTGLPFPMKPETFQIQFEVYETT